MDQTERVLAPFRAGGASIVAPVGDIRARLSGVRAFLFDWDGVFNTGRKSEGSPSGFSEADSMGTNLLRFAWWLRDQRSLPFTGILTGQDNPTAVRLAERERFQAVYRGFLNKRAALDDIQTRFDIRPERICFVFDDVLDLGVAGQCGLRILVRNGGAPLLAQYAEAEGLCEYVTGREGGAHAVRETAELLLGLTGDYQRVVTERASHSDLYRSYLDQRSAGAPVVLSPDDV
ncbi:MAG: phosphatase [Gemmatimonadetes bacterium]|nr:phosphatase [Gemmatimonadota bacterium]